MFDFRDRLTLRGHQRRAEGHLREQLVLSALRCVWQSLEQREPLL
jgi:hypothetical protein